jgi:hydroxyethylthiazole kinase-like uncharacterized protein yjeF
MRLDDLPVLSVEETRAAEQAVFDAGTDPYALMCRAGEGAAEIIWRVGHKRPVLVLCGPGNNGGDGFVIAGSLRDRGVPVRVAAIGESKTASSQRARADWGGPVEDIAHAEPAAQVVDALFGIGLTCGVQQDRWCSLIEAAQHSYAIDVPSGVESDTAALLSPVPRFDICLALGVLKPAHVLLPAAERARSLVHVPIGLDAADAPVRVLAAPRLSVPAADAHKYKRGLVAVVAGPMAGASALAAEAAARGGAGYVRIIGAQAILDLPHAIVRVSTRDATALPDPRIAALLVGPGLGRGEDARARLAQALAPAHPAVIDADGLIALGELGFDVMPPQCILTPHEGEFTALFGDLPGNRIAQALAAARTSGAVVVLKGNDTVIAAPDGQCRIAYGAPSWLSTAGTGDVLAGLCAARLAVTRDPMQAACEAVWLHGEAARRAGAAFIADDLLAHVPAAIGSRL